MVDSNGLTKETKNDTDNIQDETKINSIIKSSNKDLKKIEENILKTMDIEDAKYESKLELKFVLL